MNQTHMHTRTHPQLLKLNNRTNKICIHKLYNYCMTKKQKKPKKQNKTKQKPHMYFQITRTHTNNSKIKLKQRSIAYLSFVDKCFCY